MGVRRRTLLSAGAASAVVLPGCLSNDLPLYQVQVYNDTDRRVNVDVDVVHRDSGTVVARQTVRPGPSGSEDARRTVLEEFEAGEEYEATAAWNGYTEGEMFRADETGARKLTFEVSEDGIATRYSGP